MRFLIRDLQPKTDYGVQLRSSDGKRVGDWSVIFKMTTNVNTQVPKTPTNVVWGPSGDSFYAEWDEVTEDVSGKPTTIQSYEIEMTGFGGTKKTKVVPAKTDGTRDSYTLTYAANLAMFPQVGEEDTKGSGTITMRIRAVDKSDLKSDWSTPIVGNNAAPDPVTNLVATPGQDFVALTWDAPIAMSDVAGFDVHVGLSADFVPTLENRVWLGLTTTYTYYTSTYVPHFFKVYSVDAFDQHSTAATVSATPISPFIWDEVPPETPTGLAITEDTGTAVVLTWNPPGQPDDSLSGYYIQYIKVDDIGAVPGEDPYLLADMKLVKMDDAETLITTASITGLDAYSDYEFKIRSFDTTSNLSPWSSTVTRIGVPNVPPTQPAGLTVEVKGSTFIATWNRHADPEVIAYILEVDKVSTFNGPFKRTYYTSQPISATDKPFQEITKLDEETTYYLRVRAVDSAADKPDTEPDTNKSPWYPTPPATVSAVTEVDAPPPSDGLAPSAAPTVTLVAGIGYISLDWDAITNADPVTYDVHVSTTNNFTPSAGTLTLKTSATGAFIQNDAGGVPLAYGMTYYFKVIPRDADGSGPASTQVSGEPRKATGTDIVSLNAGQITTGTLGASIITIGPGGSIKSSGTEYTISETGITINNGTISAGTIKGGTITSTTVNVGSGGVINVDSTASIKSNNYVASTSGWKLSSTGLEVNGITGQISASNISGGTFNAGAIYVASGGGIYDTNGWWSITPSSISIQNGSISASTITSGSLRSNQPARDQYGNSISGEYAWQVDMQGDAVFGNAFVRGRIVVGTSSGTGNGVIQSSYWSPGSSGFKIDSNGTVEFNQATINAGLFRSQTTGQRVEMGNTGGGDPADEVRMFNNGTVTSMRHISGSSGWVYFNVYNGAVALHPTNDGWVAVQRGSTGPMLKFVSGGLQVRDSNDSAYVAIQASAFTVSSEAQFKKNISTVPIDTTGVLKQNGLHKWKWAGVEDELNSLRAKPVEEFVPSTMALLDEDGKRLSVEEKEKKHKLLGEKAKKAEIDAVKARGEEENYGLMADNLPDWLRTEDGYSVTAVTAFLWESLKQSNDRIEALEAQLKKP